MPAFRILGQINVMKPGNGYKWGLDCTVFKKDINREFATKMFNVPQKHLLTSI